jgi:hypothetical protein
MEAMRTSRVPGPLRTVEFRSWEEPMPEGPCQQPCCREMEPPDWVQTAGWSEGCTPGIQPAGVELVLAEWLTVTAHSVVGSQAAIATSTCCHMVILYPLLFPLPIPHRKEVAPEAKLGWPGPK